MSQEAPTRFAFTLSAEAALNPFSDFTARHKLFVVLVVVFSASLLLGDIIGGKTLSTVLGPISVGILPFPVTFLLTDVVNDFYGRAGARFITFVGFGVAMYAYFILQIGTRLPVDASTYFTQVEFEKIFGGSAVLFVASMIAYLLGQFLDIHVFQFWKRLTQSRHLWLRATGSTVISQLVDTITINTLFWGWTATASADSFLAKMDTSARWTWIAQKIGREYGIKVLVAFMLTPVVYAIHRWIIAQLKIEAAAHEGAS